MSKIFACLLVAATSFSVVGCAVQDATVDGDEPVDASEDALALASLYGAWTGEAGIIYNIEFSKTYAETLGGFIKGRSFTATIDTGVRCITTPCPSETTVSGVYKLVRGNKLTLSAYDKPSREFAKILGDYGVKMSSGTLTLSKVGGPVQSFVKSCAPNTKACTLGTHYDGTPGVCACVANPKGYCNSDADCRLENDYCTGCDCRALASTEKLAVCTGPGVRCLRAPCGGLTARCVSNVCSSK